MNLTENIGNMVQNNTAQTTMSQTDHDSDSGFRIRIKIDI